MLASIETFWLDRGQHLRMNSRGVHLQYSFESTGQRGAALHNPLFELLQAVH